MHLSEPALLVVGGGAAGLAAAAEAARWRPHEVLVLDQAPLVSIGTCALPYLIGGQIEHPSQLILNQPAQLLERGIRLHTQCCVQEVDLKNQRVQVRFLDNGRQQWIPYQKLLLSPGASHATTGHQYDNVQVPRDLVSSLKARAYLERTTTQDVLIVGAGYLGIELAEAAVRRGKRVRIVDPNPQTSLLGLDSPLAEHVMEELAKNGIEWVRGRVAGWEGGPSQARVALLQDGGDVHFDLALVATGIRPSNPLLDSLALARGTSGGIKVDRQARTSVRDVFAAGDCCEIPGHYQSSQSHQFQPLARPAALLGQVAGACALGPGARYAGSLECVAIKVFDLEVAWVKVAHNEERLYRLTHWSASKPSYWPGNSKLGLSLHCSGSPEGRLVGAQAVGKEGAVARIQTLALAISQGLNSSELGHLDHAYTPPLTALWDPIGRTVRANRKRAE